jgi:DNA-binding transcriptional MocR family regulator
MPTPRYKPLVDQLAMQIRSGELPAGERLPTHRTFAKQHGLAIATASRVYAELEKMGLVVGEVGRGTFVREMTLPKGHGIDQPEVPTHVRDLNFNYPALPEQTQLLRNALRTLSNSGDLESLLRYQPHAGRSSDREAFAHHLEQRQLFTDAANILIVDGAQHGLTVAAMAMFNAGDVIATDELTYPGMKVLAESLGLELIAIPSLSTGPDLSALEHLCKTRKVKGLYTQPTLHNPLGWVLDLDTRQRIASIAERFDLVIIEDAPYAYLDEAPPPPIAMLAPERTLYVSGFSKNIATGLRVGYVVAPTQWVSRCERAIRATTWNTAGIMTALVTQWITDGTVERLEKEKRRDAAARQLLLQSTFNEVKVIAHPNAYFAWIKLPDDVRAGHVIQRLMDSHISVSSAEPFSITNHTPHALRLALGSIPLDDLKTVLDTVHTTILECAYGV